MPKPLAQITADVQIGSVTADEAYDTRKYRDANATYGAAAVITQRYNTKP